MKTTDSWKLALISFVLICLALPAPILAQDAPAKVFKQEELDQLLAPVALYPDDLLTQIFIASTYPLEVVQADRWLNQNKDLKGDAMKTALAKQTWDVSVKSLIAFPSVLKMMNDKLDWTQKLGDAFLTQQKDVMATVQKLRKKAVDAGNLKSTKEQELKTDGNIIIIQPANPQVIYVPTYNPTVVYGTWWYPAYPPYPVYVYPPGAALFTFSMGVAIGASWHGGGYHSDWHGGTVIIDRSVNINTSGRPATKPSGDGAKAEQWKHNPDHRQGVAYPDAATRDKYSPSNHAAVDNRKDYRGYGQSGTGVADKTASRQPAQAQDRMSGQQGPKANNQYNAFAGMDRGEQAKQDSARGSQSISSTRSQGGKSSRPSRSGGSVRR